MTIFRAKNWGQCGLGLKPKHAWMHPWGWGLEMSLGSPVCFQYFLQFKGECWPGLLRQNAQLLYNTCIHCPCPGLLMYDWIFSTNSRALLPTFCTNCPDGSHFAQMGSHFAHNNTPNPCSAVTHPFLGDIPTQKHLKPSSKRPFSLAWTWMWAKWTTAWAIWTPTEQNIWKVGKAFLEVGKKITFIGS